jgi:hypothetical protein
MKTIGEMMSINKHNALAAMQSWIDRPTVQTGYWLTLDAPHVDKRKPDAVQFEQMVGKFAVRLNNYCYGRSFRRGQKRLIIVGAMEIGHFMDRPHAHLVVLHDGDMLRSFGEVESKSREIWYALVGARGDINGSLVDIQPVGDIDSRLSYSVKQFNAYSDQYGRPIAF